MSTSAWIASMPARTWVISRSSGPRTAATMQNSEAPVAAVSLAAWTSSGMFSHTDRTGEVNWPDWEQKWQSSGQPPVLSDDDALDLDLRAAGSSGPRGPAAAARGAGRRAARSTSTSSSSSPRPSSRTLRRARCKDVGHDAAS